MTSCYFANSADNSYAYSYDNYGNRLQKRTYVNDVLLKKYTWTRGRLLERIENGNGSVVGQYTYDINGVRYTKKVGSVTTTYFYNGNTLLGENRSDGTRLRYFYDATGLCGFSYYNGNETKYYTYVKDVLGNIVMIKDDMGLPLVKYTYNEWGVCSMTAFNLDNQGAVALELGNLNPFRYRGYYYDIESGLYYLMSRYYDPEIGQFISMDTPDYLGPQTIGGVDLYAYGLNNPVMYVDPTGHLAISTLIWIIVGAAILTTVGAIAYGVLEEETIVLDLSYTFSLGTKIGASLLLDFEGSNIELYPHIGQSSGMGSGLTYSIGKVWNYDGPGSYKGLFFFAGGGYYVGVDVCFNPINPLGASATSITFSSGISMYQGFDWYFDPISFNYKEWIFNKIEEED